MLSNMRNLKSILSVTALVILSAFIVIPFPIVGPSSMFQVMDTLFSNNPSLEIGPSAYSVGFTYPQYFAIIFIAGYLLCFVTTITVYKQNLLFLVSGLLFLVAFLVLFLLPPQYCLMSDLNSCSSGYSFTPYLYLLPLAGILLMGSALIDRK